MDRIFLQVSYSEREAAKSLGARWDNDARKWYVPSGRDLEPFSKWLPAELQPSWSTVLTEPASGSTELAPATQLGTRLSELLTRVSSAISKAFPAPVWVIVEVVEAKVNNHVYLDLAERDAQGSLLARARAMIWAKEAANTSREKARFIWHGCTPKGSGTSQDNISGREGTSFQRLAGTKP